MLGSSKEYKLAIKIAGKIDNTFTRAFGKAGSVMKKIVGIAAAVAGAAIAVGVAFVKMAKKTAAYGDEVAKSSQKIGMSTESYQKWKYVLNQSGMDISNLRVGMKKFNGAIADSSSTGAKALQALGVNVKGLSQSQAFDKTITALQGMKDETQKAYYATQLFGKSGQNMIPLLNKSAKSTQALKDRAEELGLVMSEKAVKGAEEYQDSLEELHLVGQGLRNNLMSAFLPGLAKITKHLSNWVGGLSKAVAKAGGDPKKLGKAFGDKVGQAIEYMSKHAEGFFKNIGIFIGFFFAALAKHLPAIGKALGKLLLKGLYNLLKVMGTGIGKLNGLIGRFFKWGFTAIGKLILGLLKGAAKSQMVLPLIILKLIRTGLTKLGQFTILGLKAIGRFFAGIEKGTGHGLKTFGKLIAKLLAYGLTFLPKMLALGVKIVLNIALGLVKAIPKLLEKAKQLISKLWDKIKNTNWFDLGVKILKAIGEGLLHGIESIAETVKNKLKDLFTFDVTGSTSKTSSGGTAHLSIAHHAVGGIYKKPTLLHQVAESGSEAILPLTKFWSNLNNAVKRGMSVRAAKVVAATDTGGLGSGGDTINYSPNYYFYGDAPTKDDIVAAETMTQKKFNAMMKKYEKDKKRTKL